MVGEHGLDALRLFGGVEQVVEDTRIVVEVPEVEVLRKRLHELDLPVLELAHLTHDVASEGEDPAPIVASSAGSIGPASLRMPSQTAMSNNSTTRELTSLVAI